MEPSTAIDLRRQLEAIKEFERKNAPSKTSYFGYWGELLLGTLFLGRIIIMPIQHLEGFVFIPWLFFALAVYLILQGSYLILRYNIDKRFRLLLEAVLSASSTQKS
jgi:hypothetical protein